MVPAVLPAGKNYQAITNMTQGHHHIKKHTHKRENNLIILMDKLMYVIALIAPVMTIPQLVGVMNHHVAGVSLATWGAYAFVSALWLLYGILHKDKPLILTQFLLLILDGAIVIFVLLYS